MTGSLDISLDRCVRAAPPVKYPKPPRIIALCGRKRSGKDTAASALRGFGYKRAAFADPLKAMLVALLRAQAVPDDDIEAAVHGVDREMPLLALNGRSARQALQTLGTEWGRDLMHPDLWMDATLRMIDANPDRRFVISDLRFPNEAAGVRARSGVIVRITRPSDFKWDAHVSEKFVDHLPVDHEVENVAEDALGFSLAVSAFYNAAFA